MYTLRIEATASPEYCGEYERRMQETGELLQRHDGFMRGALLVSTSNLTKYTRMLRFASRETAHGWLTSPELAKLVANQPLLPIYASQRPVEGYEPVHIVSGDGLAIPRFAHLADWTVDPAKAAVFEADRKELFDLRKQKGTGFVAMILLRFGGGQGRYLMYSISNDESSHRESVSQADVRAWVQAHPAASYGGASPVQETYDIVQTYGP